MKKEKHISIRIEEDLLNKLHYVSKYYGRSTSGHIMYSIRMMIHEFEQKNGVITEDDIKEMKEK